MDPSVEILKTAAELLLSLLATLRSKGSSTAEFAQLRQAIVALHERLKLYEGLNAGLLSAHAHEPVVLRARLSQAPLDVELLLRTVVQDILPGVQVVVLACKADIEGSRNRALWPAYRSLLLACDDLQRRIDAVGQAPDAQRLSDAIRGLNDVLGHMKTLRGSIARDVTSFVTILGGVEGA